MKKTFPRFDMARDPIRTRWYLKPITALLSFPAIIRHKTVIHRHGHHVNSPFWNLHERHVKPTEADFTLLYTAEELFFAWRRSIGRPCKPGLA